MHGLSRQSWLVYFIAGLASVCLSYWANVREVVINPDAICYLQSAQTMKMGLNAAMQLCGQAKWPFYSALIYAVANLTHLSYLHSAYFLDGILSCISVLVFIAIVKNIGMGSRFSGNDRTSNRLLWLAALVILLCHEFNAVRVYLVRDHGFWAFYLVSILFLLNYFRTRQWCYALGWSMSLIIATLFRIEGVIFLIALPFIAFICQQPSRFKSFLKLNLMTGIGVAIGAVCFFINPPQHINHLNRVTEVQYQLLHGVNAIAYRFQENAETLSQHVLSQYSAHDAMLILFLVLMAWYFISVIVNLSVIYTILVIYAWARKLLMTDQSSRVVLWSYILVNVVITAAFLFENMFLSKRYLLALSLTLMLWVPFALNDLLQQWQKRKWPFCVAIFFMVVSSLGGIFDFGYSKAYIHDAGLWLEKNVPSDAKLYVNDYQLMYYSQHFGNDIFAKGMEYADLNKIAHQKWKYFDYVAVRMNKNEQGKNASIVQALGKPIQVFMNKRGDAVSIYQIRGNAL